MNCYQWLSILGFVNNWFTLLHPSQMGITMLLDDISPLLDKSDHPNMAQDERAAQVVRELDLACREAGFFYVTGHGIPQIRSIKHEYFHQPYEDKLKIKLSAETGYRGYQRIGENITKGTPDMHEAIDCYREVKHRMYGDLGEVMQGSNIRSSSPPNFKQLVEEYVDHCTVALLYCILF
ncbi:homoarginine-6-hydroxylase 2-ODD-C23 [Nicotiana tabacum]|uniref:Homoarginine-6-hydroxylase 2-ODD-C23 n=1 Tax=Nicotiana tabacum TaxID=4097 RepID=A0A1S4A4C1_TOBAC|nr:probable 2-oxoglutarate-dependent dioxygenase At3g50210 [Nicotiana tomentosiformis]XP_016471421.1 PREDICTED: probable 2-oxoglutarate-dependent dioxygenase At3g49630 [Nicotiana tabacum]